MRIGIVTSSYPLSAADTVGAGVFVRDLAHDLAAAGHAVHVLTPRKFGEAEESTSVTVHYFPWVGGEKDLASASLRNPWTLLRYSTLVGSGLWSVSRYAAAHALEATLAMWAIPSGLFSWWTWKRHRIPYGVWALGSDIWARHKYPFGDSIVRAVLQEASFCFADGRGLAREVESLARVACSFVPSVRRLSAPAGNPKLSLPRDSYHFLFIGRYESNKGPDTLVEAMRLFLDRGHSAHLWMFGVGSLRDLLRERIRGYEAYIHLGGYADMQTAVAYLQACQCLVIPSRIESIPLVFVDALQMHRPMIVTDVGDLGCLASQYGVGQVVPPDEPSALALAMERSAAGVGDTATCAWAEALELFDTKQSVQLCLERLSEAISAVRREHR